MPYEQPDKGAGFAPSEHPEWTGQLFLIWPKSVENVVFTKNDGTPDPTDMVTADVAIVTLVDPKTGAPTMLKNARVGGKAFTPQIKNKVGKKVLGKFVQLPKQPGKNAAYCLDVPEASSPEWAQMCQLAEQYEAAHPYTDGYAQAETPAWQTQQTTTPAWQQQATPPPASATSWNNPPVGSTAPNGAAPAAGAAWNTQQTPASATTTPPPAVDPWPPGLRKFLTDKGYDTTGMDEATARQIAAASQ